MSASLPISDQLIQGNRASLWCSDWSTDMVMHAIYRSPLIWSFSSCSSFFCNPFFSISGQLTSGRESSFFFRSSGMEIVTLFIYITSCICMYICIYMEVFISFVDLPIVLSMTPFLSLMEKC
jgi:hypothetical protein